MFREIRGIGDETILSAIHRLPAFYFQGGWADEIRMELFRLPAGGEEALRITLEGGHLPDRLSGEDSFVPGIGDSAGEWGKVPD